MVLKLRVTQAGNTWPLTWEDGDVSGDRLTVEHVRRMAETARVFVAYLPACIGKDTLDDPKAFYELCRNIFDRVEIIEGQLPPLPSVPDGAVA